MPEPQRVKRWRTGEGIAKPRVVTLLLFDDFGKRLVVCSNYFGFKRGVFVYNATKNILKAIELLIQKISATIR